MEFFIYPVSQASDITASKATLVPVGEDQEPIRKRRKEFEEDIPGLYGILRSGSYNARIIAKNTLEEVRDAIGINYFKQL